MNRVGVPENRLPIGINNEDTRSFYNSWEEKEKKKNNSITAINLKMFK